MLRASSFAYRSSDTAEVRLKKTTIFLVAASCCVAGCLWSLMYALVFGWGLTTFLPLSFAVIVGMSLVVSNITKNHYYAVYAQIVCIIYITTFIQWSIGGVFDSGFVMAWAFCGPIVALIFFPLRKSFVWFALYLLNVVITVAFDNVFASRGYDVANSTQLIFFIMNLGVSSFVIFLFASYFVAVATLERRRADSLLDVVIPIGIELASEKDFNRLLEKMLVEAKTFCNANAGLIYLKTEDNRLQFVIVRDDSKGLALGGSTGGPVTFEPLPLYYPDGKPNDRHVCTRVALEGKTVNIRTPQDAMNFDMTDIRIYTDGNPTSLLAVPLKNSRDEVLGVLQLMDHRDPEMHKLHPFDDNLQEMIESFSTLAVAALEAYIREQNLRQQIREMRMEIDETRKQQEISEITETGFFHELTDKASKMREARKRDNKLPTEP